MKKSKVTRSLLAACSIVALSAVMYGCVHSGDGDDTPPPVVEPEPTAYESGLEAIQAADTAAAAQAAYDAVDLTAVSGDEAAKLQAALSTRLADIATAARVATQKTALMTAAGNIDTSDLSTADAIAAANTAITALQAALDAAADVSDADKATYQTQLDTAKTAVSTAQDALDTSGRIKTQRMAISSAVTTARDAVGMVDDDATDAEVTAADSAITALEEAIEGAADIPEGDADVASAQGTLDTLKGQLSTAKTSRTAAMEAKAKEEQKKKEEQAAKEATAMMALAEKLLDGIGAPGSESGDAGTAAYDGTNDSEIVVTRVGVGGVNLKEDKKATVAALDGWTGKKYTHTVPSTATNGPGDMYEAVVYSHVGKATEGAKFSATYAYNNDADTALKIDANTEHVISTDTTAVQGRIASPSFDQSAGKKEFPLGTNEARVIKSGTYHGVSGSYYCKPTTTCTATVAADGFTLTGGSWTFKANNKDDRLMDTPDADYESYGWWFYESADGKTLAASAFRDNKGANRSTVAIGSLRGKATYEGSAAGKYALYSATGGTNDAGSFTATATLKAIFAPNADNSGSAHTISGTIDNFMGADGMARDWSVELKETDISDSGNIDGLDSGNEQVGTVWTIGGTAAANAGEWSGSLQEVDDDDDVPMVATGTFHSIYGTATGEMVGAFGATKE